MNGQQLAQSWAAVYQGAAEAIDWIGAVRPTAKRLDNEAEDLTLSLRRIRNLSRRLGSVAERPMTVGFFGLSQAGKSYLISSLAAGENGKLETDLAGSRLDFIEHINPSGGGKEATGLVTRFSRTAQPGPGDYPLVLKLFSEIELAKVLANAFFNDFDHKKLQYSFHESELRAQLSQLAARRYAQPVPGVTADDVVSLWDYLEESFPALIRSLNGYYWPQAVELAPYLSPEDRTQLFAIFWGGLDELSESYLGFARTLSALGHAEQVYAPLSALVHARPQGGFSQSDSIMNVDILERLGQPSDQQIKVRPWRNGAIQPEVSLSLAQLAALTVELVVPLAEPTREPLFEQVDLLDFPGYRGRVGAESIEDVRRKLGSDEVSPVAQLLLRGKVAYLFERYTDAQEMNVLIVCTPSNRQSDVTSVGPVLSKWIGKTQGETPEERAKRRSGLLWAITMFDLRIGNDLNQNEDLLRLGWGGMMKATMLERFGQYDWLQEWVAGQPFANTFLVRKPRMKGVAFLNLQADGEELGFNPATEPQLGLIRQTFIEDATVNRHVAQAPQAWDAMLALNDGGMGRISDYLQQVARIEVKLERIAEQLSAVLHQLENRLGHWFHAEGAGELEKKRRIAKQIFEAVWPRRPLLGELMQRMQLPDERLRALYLSADQVEVSAPKPQTAEPAAVPSLALDFGSDLSSSFDPFAEPAPVAAIKPAEPSARGSDARFAQAVLREWISHLRHIPEQTALVGYLGISREAIEALMDELITASTRVNLQQRLLDAVATTEQVGSKREQLVGRQVLSARTVLGDFIGWLGMAEQPLTERPDSRFAAGQKLFQTPAPIPYGQLPKMAALPQNHSERYLADWMSALIRLAEDNAGHSAGREITPEQNEALGRVLARFKQAQVG